MPFTRCDNDLLNIISTKFLEALLNLEIVLMKQVHSLTFHQTILIMNYPAKLAVSIIQLVNMNLLIKNKISTSSTAILMA